MGTCVSIEREHVRLLVATTPAQRPLTEADLKALANYFASEAATTAGDRLALEAIARLIAELKGVSADAARFRWLYSSHPGLDKVVDDGMRIDRAHESAPW